jgi:hypothetical protein
LPDPGVTLTVPVVAPLHVAVILGALLAGAPGVVHAETAKDRATQSKGRPRVVLNDLNVSASPLAAERIDAIKKLLEREARRADWGAGREAKIEYRFRIDELVAEESAGVVRVRCAATGFLPKGKSAKSKLSFGGAPSERDALIDRVLGIVTQGVVTRLADLERRRRLR